MAEEKDNSHTRSSPEENVSIKRAFKRWEPTGISESPYKLLRMLTGLSGNQFADRIQISRTYWNDLETGRRNGPSPEVQLKIATACKLDPTIVQYLVENDSSKTEELYQFIISQINGYLKRTKLSKFA